MDNRKVIQQHLVWPGTAKSANGKRPQKLKCQGTNPRVRLKHNSKLLLFNLSYSAGLSYNKTENMVNLGRDQF